MRWTVGPRTAASRSRRGTLSSHRGRAIPKGAWGCCDAAMEPGAEFSGILGYWLASNGKNLSPRVFYLQECPNGHKRTRMARLEAVDLEPVEGRRVYVMGAAAGYMQGVREARAWFAGAVRNLLQDIPDVDELAGMMGRNRTFVERCKYRQMPMPLTDQQARLLDYVLNLKLA